MLLLFRLERVEMWGMLGVLAGGGRGEGCVLTELLAGFVVVV